MSVSEEAATLLRSAGMDSTIMDVVVAVVEILGEIGSFVLQ